VPLKLSRNLILDIIFLALLDLTLCAILCKLCLTSTATGLILKDPQTDRIYYLSTIQVGKREQSEKLDEDIVEEEDDDYGERGARLMSSNDLEDLGWEGMIIAQLISS